MSPWTQDECALALRLRKGGMPYAAIGARIGRSKDAVQTKLAEIDPRYTRGATRSDPKADAELNRLRGKGLTFREIGIAMGRSETWAQRRAKDLGLAEGAFMARGKAIAAARLGNADLAPPRPRGYSREARAWALANPLNPEGGLILMHLVERGELAAEAVRKSLRKQARAT